MARVPCPPTPGPRFGYYCEDEEHVPVAVPYVVDGDGTPLVQAPLKFCGDDSPVCPDSSVSGCISDTDGAPTTYGAAPVAPEPGDVAGPSPRFSRLRINRTGLAVFPYSTTKRPDQLFDLVLDQGEDEDPLDIPWNPATGRFTLPPYPGTPDIPTLETYYDVIEVSEISLVDDQIDNVNTRITAPLQTITNPSATLTMRVILHYTVQVGVEIIPEQQAIITPSFQWNIPADPDDWTSAWEQETFPNKSEDNISGGTTISFATSKTIPPSTTVEFAAGVTIAPHDPFGITAITPVSLFLMAHGHSYDA